jgi:hypothetical protein
MHDVRELTDLVESWQAKRVPLAEEFSKKGMRDFVAYMNHITRQAVAVTGKTDPEFWTAMLEIAQHASTLTTPGAKVIADKQDRTQL